MLRGMFMKRKIPASFHKKGQFTLNSIIPSILQIRGNKSLQTTIPQALFCISVQPQAVLGQY